MNITTTQDATTQPKTFKCHACKQTKPQQETGGTGYGRDEKNRKICYQCCAERDAQEMKDTGKATLYLTSSEENGYKKHSVTNWPGTLKFSAYVQQGRHNIAGTRYDAWFTDRDGHQWHGVQYGDNTQIIHCKRLKHPHN